MIGALNGVLPFIRRPWQKKTLSISVAVGLATAVLSFYYVYTGDILPEWPVLLLTVAVVQASYALITKNTATAVEDHYTRGETRRRYHH